MRSLATRGAASELSAAVGRRARRAPARRLRPDLRRDRRHRPGRRGHRRRRGPLDLRHDRRVRRPDPAREDRDAGLRRPRRRSTSSPAAAARTPCATCASSSSATTTCFDRDPASLPVFGTSRRPLQRLRRQRPLRPPRGAPERDVSTWAGTAPSRPASGASPTPPRTSSRRAASATWPRSPAPAASTAPGRREQAEVAADLDGLRRAIALLGGPTNRCWKPYPEGIAAGERPCEAAGQVAGSVSPPRRRPSPTWLPSSTAASPA